MRHQIPASRLRDILDYDPCTGVFTWKRKMSSRALAGQIAGCPNGKGYWIISFDGVIYMAHRLAWAFVHDVCPAHLDHINGDGLDNRLGNLRPCTQATNNRNMAVRRRKRSALKGVTRQSTGGSKPWRARIVVNKREIALGSFATEEEAHAAYQAAAREHFGEFARTA